jgi:hypothetical protein
MIVFDGPIIAMGFSIVLSIENILIGRSGKFRQSHSMFIVMGWELILD